MSAPTGKVRTLRTLGDLLELDADEFARLLPDLQAWHLLCRECINLVGTEPKDFANSIMEWTDDGDPGTIKGVRIVCGDTVFDLAEQRRATK